MSEPLPDNFGDQLVAREEVDPMRLEQLREQVAAVMERKLSRRTRVAGIVGGVLLVVVGLLPLAGLAARWDELPYMAHAVVAAGVVCTVLIGLILIGVARRGVYDVRYHSKQLVVVAFWACLGIGGAFMHFGWESGDREAVYSGTVVLAVGAGAFVMHMLEQYYLATKRKLLELELRLAEIAERLDRTPPGGK